MPGNDNNSGGARVRVQEFTNFGEYSKALESLKFSAYAGEKVVSAVEKTTPGVTPWHPSISKWELTTVSGKTIILSNVEKIALKPPANAENLIRFAGAGHDQFFSNQGYYQ